ncbi:MAG: hypothetical protein SVR94_10675 [Pseudomonadota bacterium]|nr:hypothetical protein [Pseudomonadota bacterium]
MHYDQARRGAALILMLLLVVLGAISLLLSELNQTPIHTYRQFKTAQALAQAKAALLGFAATYSETHPGQPQGYLLCPDQDGDGDADVLGHDCGQAGTTIMGRFPWKTLGLPPLRDGSGSCLWYVVSGSYKDKSAKNILTSDSNGLLIVANAQGEIIAGETPQNRAIALIFAPGPPIGRQSRSRTPASNPTLCGSDNPTDDINQAHNYLEQVHSINNATGQYQGYQLPTAQPTLFVMGPRMRATHHQAQILFNDSLTFITPADFAPVYQRMQQWVAQRVYHCLTAYAQNNQGHFPWAAPLDNNSPEYHDAPQHRLGRIPEAQLVSTQESNPSMSTRWLSDPQTEHLASSCGIPQCFNALQSATCSGFIDKAGYWWWWQQWKELVFFAVNEDYSPQDSQPNTAGQLNLAGNPQKVIVLVAGRTLSTQRRQSQRDKANINNYLEGGNQHFNPGVHETFFAHAAGEFNDTLCPSRYCP